MTYGAYRRALDRIAQGLLRTIMRLILTGWDPAVERDPQIRVLAPAVAAEVRAARQRMNELAGEFLQAQAEAQLGRGVVAAPPPPPTDYTDRAAATTLRQNLSGPRQTAARKVGAATVRHAEQAARDAVEQSAVEWKSEPAPADPEEDERPEPPKREQVKAAVDPEPEQDQPRRSRLRISFGDEDDEPETTEQPAVLENPDAPEGARPVAWARVLSGAENCAFCIILASRGPVYRTKASSGGLDATRFHSFCDCESVPIYDGAAWGGQQQADWLYENVYLPAIGGKPWIGWESNHWKDNVPVQRLEEWLKEHPLDLPDIRTT